MGGLPPVIMVPGLVGSVLEAKQDDAPRPHWYCKSTEGWHKVWIDVDETLFLPCLNSLLNLSFDVDAAEYVNTPGVQIRPRDFGGVHGIDYMLPLYKEWQDIIKTFEARGYVVGKDLHGAPYDWRLAGDGHAVRTALGVGGFYENLKTLIEQTVDRNGEPASIVAHSLGCPTMHYFFHSYVSSTWLGKFVKQFVPMAGPWAGTGQAVHLLISGDPGAAFLPEAIWKPVQSKDASTVWMLPLSSAFGDTVVLRNETHNFTAADRSLILEAAGLPKQKAMYDHMHASGADFRLWQKFVPGLQTHFFHSVGIKTPVGFTYKGAFGANFSNAPSDVQYDDGDGTINARSLTAFKQWSPDVLAINNTYMSMREFHGISHSGMLSDTRVIQALIDLLVPSDMVV